MGQILGFGGFKTPQKNCFGTFQGVRGHAVPKNFENRALKLAKNAFPAYSYGHKVS